MPTRTHRLLYYAGDRFPLEITGPEVEDIAASLHLYRNAPSPRQDDALRVLATALGAADLPGVYAAGAELHLLDRQGLLQIHTGVRGGGGGSSWANRISLFRLLRERS